MKLTLSHPKLVSLAAGFTDNPSLPVQEAHSLLGKLLGRKSTGQPALQYGSTVGDPSLRQLTAGRLHREDESAAQRDLSAKTYSPEKMVITHGSQQLLYLTTEALCDEGDIVLVEDPTYFVYLGILQSRGVQGRGVRLEKDGLSLEHLEQILESLKKSGEIRKLKMVYLVTYFQNPSSVTMSFEKKKRVLQLLKRYEAAAGHPLYLLEDAAYRELRFEGPDVASALAATGARDRVIYAGTYSKPFASGARVGFGILPEPLWTAVTRIKGNHDFGTANLLQQLLASALRDGIYAHHLPRLQARYAAKAKVMVQAIRKEFPTSVQWEIPRGGLYVWASLPESVPTGLKSSFFKAAIRKEVLYVPGELCYVQDPQRRRPDVSMRLSFGGAHEASIRAGITRLGEVIRTKR